MEKSTDRSKTQLLRLIFIDRKIREGMRTGIFANCRTMAEEYEVSRKSILRDIDYLKNQRDAPIAYDSLKKGYFYTEEHYALPAMSLSESDFFAICIAEQALRQYRGTPLFHDLQKVFRKIEDGLSDSLSISSALSSLPIHFLNRGQARIDSEVWTAISRSIKKDLMISIRYLKAGDHKTSQRHLDPYRLLSYSGEWYLMAFCHMRKKILTFALSRVQQAVILEEKRQTEEPDHLGDQILHNFGIFSGAPTHQLRVIFHGKAAHIVKERIWHPEQRIEELEDNRICLSFPAGDLGEIKRWILGWGREAVVENPPELVEELKGELRAMAGLYPDKKY